MVDTSGHLQAHPIEHTSAKLLGAVMQKARGVELRTIANQSDQVKLGRSLEREHLSTQLRGSSVEVYHERCGQEEGTGYCTECEPKFYEVVF